VRDQSLTPSAIPIRQHEHQHSRHEHRGGGSNRARS
jgi:hypothetical protein